MQPKVSVIIPAYNAEKYVGYAVNSALRQTLDDIEIIVINDCSTDKTLDVLAERFSGEGKVRVFTQPENMGVAEARNRGIREAGGEFIVFLDSDDVMLEHMLKTLYDHSDGADVVSSSGTMFGKREELPDDLSTLGSDELVSVNFNQKDDDKEPFTLPSDMTERMQGWIDRKYNYLIWNKLFRREFLIQNDITFDHLSMAEDCLFVFKCQFFAKTYRMIPDKLNVYRTGGAESLSKQKKSIEVVRKLVGSMIDTARYMSVFLDEQDYFKQNRDIRVGVVWSALDVIDTYYLSPAIEEIGVEKVQKDEDIHQIFVNSFGDNSTYAEYMFYLMHSKEGTAVDINGIFGNSGSWGGN